MFLKDQSNEKITDNLNLTDIHAHLTKKIVTSQMGAILANETEEQSPGGLLDKASRKVCWLDVRSVS